jgi:hypothetical protein
LDSSDPAYSLVIAECSIDVKQKSFSVCFKYAGILHRKILLKQAEAAAAAAAEK